MEERKGVSVTYDDFKKNWQREVAFSPLQMEKMLQEKAKEGKGLTIITQTHEITVTAESLLAHYAESNILDETGAGYAKPGTETEDPKPGLNELDSLVGKAPEPAEEKGPSVPLGAKVGFKGRGPRRKAALEDEEPF